ncbi:MAG: GlsB/YeaQ/YmgE family stress response membrane protein [Verrucomicrobiota bacterium]
MSLDSLKVFWDAQDIMSWIVTILIGFVAGALGRFLMPGKDVQGCLITTVLGIGGAALGRFLAEKAGIYAGDPGSSWDLRSMAISVGGVMVILLLYRLVLKLKGK